MLKDSNEQSSEKKKAALPQQKSAGSLQSEQAAEKAQKKKKKNWHRKERERKEAGANSEGTPATDSNATEGKKKADQNRGQNKGQNRSQQDLSQITFWNCDKRRHYATDCKKQGALEAKKLAAVSATSKSVTASLEALQRVLCSVSFAFDTWSSSRPSRSRP